MSWLKSVTLFCDECGTELDYIGEDGGAVSVVAARIYARQFDWRCGLKATVKRPSLYSDTVDICPECAN